MVLVIATGLAVLALLVAEYLQARVPKAIAKILASAGFVAIAVEAGALQTSHGQWIFAGLLLGWAGDVCLLSQEKKWFMSGLAVFLVGHLALIVGFSVRGLRGAFVGTAVMLLFAVATVVWRWLAPHVGSMKWAVLGYIAVISLMLASAIATTREVGGTLVLVGAFAFYLSDLFVARQRFVKGGFVNKLFGLPLYYAGQVLIALYAVT